jgi:hypothetical protein
MVGKLPPLARVHMLRSGSKVTLFDPPKQNYEYARVTLIFFIATILIFFSLEKSNKVKVSLCLTN